MIIRSQNKLKTTTDLNLEIYDCSDDIFVIVNQTVDTLGIYSTKEKAIKVLDMIQNAYCRMKSCDVSMCGIAVAISKQSDDIANRFIEESRNIHVFQMPQDCEV